MRRTVRLILGSLVIAAVVAPRASMGARGERRGHESISDPGPHGGLVLRAGDGYVELLGESRGLRVYLLDDDKKVQPVFRTSGRLTLERGDDKAGVVIALIPAGGYLLGKSKLDFSRVIEGDLTIDRPDGPVQSHLKSSLPETDYDASSSPSPAPPTPTPGH